MSDENRQTSARAFQQKTNQLVESEAVEVRIFWGDALLQVVELSPPRPFFIGDGARSKLPVDFTVPDAGFERVPLVFVLGGDVSVRVPPGATAVVRGGDAREGAPMDATSRSLQGATVVDVDASAEREREPEKSGDGGGQADAPDEKARGEAGKMGRRDVSSEPRRASGSAAGPTTRPATSRAEELAAAANFGLIGLLASGAAPATTAPWDDVGVGDRALAGGLFGQDLGDVGGMGGLALAGAMEGGGGLSNQIGLGSIGTCGAEGCLSPDFGVGRGRGRSGPEHVALAPRMRMGETLVHGGSLPADVIQRVVRQNFGRFRGCYEQGLRTNPTLEGRVTARFVIARDGSVATVQSGGTDLPDPQVVSCVLRAYSGLTFPSPKDGIVTVTYPLSFRPPREASG